MGLQRERWHSMFSRLMRYKALILSSTLTTHRRALFSLKADTRFIVQRNLRKSRGEMKSCVQFYYYAIWQYSTQTSTINNKLCIIIIIISAARWPPQYAPARDLDCWPFDLEVGVGVACDLGYPCAKFRLPRPFGFRVRADVRDIRQADRQTPITA